jgi:hypothetical protein
MRATDIIRGVLDLIDQVDCAQQETQPMPAPVVGSFAEIFAQMSAEPQGYDNSPDPHVQGIDSVTTNAGGGLNGPKHPADIRSDSVSMFPAYQAGVK